MPKDLDRCSRHLPLCDYLLEVTLVQDHQPAIAAFTSGTSTRDNIFVVRAKDGVRSWVQRPQP